MKVTQMSETIGGKFYSTLGARILAAGPRIDSPQEQFGNSFLFRSADGEYFAAHQGFLDCRRDKIEPLTRDRAIVLWAQLSQKLTSFDSAFLDSRISDEEHFRYIVQLFGDTELIRDVLRDLVERKK